MEVSSTFITNLMIPMGGLFTQDFFTFIVHNIVKQRRSSYCWIWAEHLTQRKHPFLSRWTAWSTSTLHLRGIHNLPKSCHTLPPAQTQLSFPTSDLGFGFTFPWLIEISNTPVRISARWEHKSGRKWAEQISHTK